MGGEASAHLLDLAMGQSLRLVGHQMAAMTDISL
jgi:hypothetical protein